MKKNKKTVAEHDYGAVNVTIQTEDRLKAIIDLSSAIKAVAKALQTSVTVNITQNEIKGGITIDTVPIVTKTMDILQKVK